MADPVAAAARARRFLHVNLNCADVDASTRFYEHHFGLRVVMEVERKPQDGSVLGLGSSIECDTSFLYDHRGPRTSPALELVQWRVPPPVGRQYDDPHHPGLQGLGFAVADPSAAPTVDPDGVALAVEPGADAELRGLDLACADVDRSVRWYRALGFEAGEGTTLRLADDPSCSLRLRQAGGEGRAHSVANHGGLYRFALSVDDIRAAAEAHGGKPSYVRLDGTPIEGMWILFLTDPDGVVVELVERPRSAFR